MRRFPAPPSASAAPSTPARSAEAPMQYEWEKPRQFGNGASPFVSSAAVGGEDERARKRPHYEAMEVDTPPRPTFPSSATATSNPFGFGHSSSSAAPPPPSTNTAAHPLSFDPNSFHPEKAFGLEEEVEMNEVSMADEAEDLLPSAGEEKENLSLVAIGARRRRTSNSRRKVLSASRPTIHTDDEETDEDEGSRADEGFLGVLKSKVGRRGGDGQFSFQVHHHHAPGGAMVQGGEAGEQQLQQQHGQAPEKWMRSGTPYVLLGYLQFSALALLAILLLSLLLLFLYTLYTDIQSRLVSLHSEVRAEIIQCAKAYVDNRCQPATRIPAMEARCGAWEECMNRDVVVSGKTRVVAETLAEVVNGFVDVISFKTMLFVVLTLTLTIYGSSVALSILPSRAAAPPQAHPPSHSPSFGYGGAPPGYPPYGLPYGPGAGQWVVDQEGGKREEGRLRVGK